MIDQSSVRHWHQDVQNGIDRLPVGERALRILVSDARTLVGVVKAAKEWEKQAGGKLVILLRGFKVYIRKESQAGSWHPWMERKITF